MADEAQPVQLKFGLTLQQIMDVVSKISLHSAPQSTQMLFAGREEPDHHDQPVAELGERPGLGRCGGSRLLTLHCVPDGPSSSKV